MSSKGRNFRRRSDDNVVSDEKTTTATATAAAAAPSSGLKPRSKPKPKPSKLLSFADEEDDDGIGPSSAPSRSSSRPPPPPPSSKHPVHKLTSAKDRSSSPSPSPSIFQPQAGEYTKERLLELQKNARPLGRSAPLPDTDAPKPPPKTPSEPIIVLKGLVKPVTPNDKDLNPRKLEINHPKNDAGDDESASLAKLGIDCNAKTEKGSDSETIPDQATIAAIRAKRERLRHSRSAAPDYISLDASGVASTRSGGGASSDEEDTDFRGRISLLGSSGDSNEKKGVFESVDERVVPPRATVAADTEGGDEEEERIWEEEQFRKALGKKLDASSGNPPSNVAVSAQSIPLVPPSEPLASNSSGGAQVLLTFSQQAEISIKSTRGILDRLKESHGRTLTSLAMTEDNLSESLSRITGLEKALEDAGSKFVYVQKLRSYISVLCDFLQDKTPYIEELEEQTQKLREDRAIALKERRSADIADEMAEVDAPVNAFVSVLSKGSGSKYLSAAIAALQAALVAAKESKNPPVQLDEFGRDLNLQKRADALRRADARKRRKARSEDQRRRLRGVDNVCHLVEGECSTDESDSESKAYQSSQEEVLQVVGQVLGDAAEEYSDLSVVKERLEDWKKQYPSSYRDAYMPLSTPDIFSPFVRLELLHWDPLNKDTDFTDMKWHDLLFDYGIPENGDDFNPDDPDANLIPELVEKVALPVLHHEIAHCWDIFSTRMTRNAVSAVKLVMNYVTPSSEPLRDLLAIVRSSLAEAVSDLVVPMWNTMVFEHILKDVPDAAYVAACRFGMAVRLLRNVCLWQDVISKSVLEEIALVELLSGKILPHLHCIMPHIHDAITRTERVVASLAGVWPGPKGEPSQKLLPLVDFVTELGRMLEKRRASGFGGDIYDHARSLKRMMVDLNEYDKARAILRTFQIKEAL